MAVRAYSTTQILVLDSCPIRRPVGRIMVMLEHRSQVSVRKIAALEIKSSFRNKVFEDQSKGIVCYRDDKGEIVCEGYDEGPRLHHELQRKNYHPRDAEIIDLLQQNWLQIVKGDEVAVGVPEDLNWNGYNTYW
ncbi:uncharacterized protein LOC117922777 [Vitis riparia]|nr:uncharacterized protein LOC100258290 [Vitis vinifera]XP_034696883.1 uncharacterized protein LOC117922777 [Vitis riparia]CAN62135.1 hypothetical protein VITISV_043719 [Vitis vinifera]|eukprot:XP_002265894.1 PREDICTED: uncharacterized protein LOC100258290 [Vitis vinifera]